jgi:hypothetical protein
MRVWELSLFSIFSERRNASEGYDQEGGVASMRDSSSTAVWMQGQQCDWTDERSRWTSTPLACALRLFCYRLCIISMDRGSQPAFPKLVYRLV